MAAKLLKKNNFIEKETLEEANNVDLDTYSFIAVHPKSGNYMFKIREAKR